MTAKISIATIFLTIALSLLASSYANIFSIGVSIYSEKFLELSFFGVFFILSRIKWFLDDIQSYKRLTTSHKAIKVSYILAIFSWFFWILSAYCTANPDSYLKYIFLSIAILIATICIMLEILVENETIKEIWLFYNLLYLLFIFVIILKLLPDYIVIVGLIFICLYDIKDSQSLLAFGEMNNKET